MTSNENFAFITVLDCIDGRTSLPLIDWAKEHFAAEYSGKVIVLDNPTEPGMDAKILMTSGHVVSDIKSKAEISRDKHGSRVIVIVGHDECAGNPVSEDVHLKNIKDGCSLVKGWGFERVVGVYVGDINSKTASVTTVCDDTL